MKFIFPKNYNFSTKILGLIDYPTAVFNLIWWLIIFIISKLIFSNLLHIVIFFIIMCFPVLLISLFGLYQENIIYVFKYLFLYFLRPKLYLYKKIN